MGRTVIETGLGMESLEPRRHLTGDLSGMTYAVEATWGSGSFDEIVGTTRSGEVESSSLLSKILWVADGSIGLGDAFSSQHEPFLRGLFTEAMASEVNLLGVPKQMFDHLGLNKMVRDSNVWYFHGPQYIHPPDALSKPADLGGLYVDVYAHGRTKVTFRVEDSNTLRVTVDSNFGAFSGNASYLVEFDAEQLRPDFGEVMIKQRKLYVTGNGDIGISTRKGRIYANVDGAVTRFPLDAVDQIIIGGDESGNRIEVGGGLPPAEIWGNGGNDTLLGGDNNDFLSGGDGADWIDGRSGKDEVYAYWKFTHDELDLRLSDVTGGDTLYGGSGNDQLFGAHAHDVLYGGGGHDRLQGIRAQQFDAGPGNDTVIGSGMDDWIDGGSGDDWIEAGSGNDTIAGRGGDDAIFGNDGHDYIETGSGDNGVFGGGGGDTIHGSDGDDDLRGGMHPSEPRANWAFGYFDHDTIYGYAGEDTLIGGFGDDFLDAGLGHDYVDGGDGDDYLFGGGGDDSLIGGSGKDVFDGSGGRDSGWVDAEDRIGGISGPNWPSYGIRSIELLFDDEI